MGARAIGSGTISFGLVAIPVKIFTTTESSSSVRFSMVHEKCGTKVKYRYYCPTDDTYVERDEIAKGYEFAKGQYVLFSEDELKALQPKATNAIEIEEFVPLAKVDPIYFEKAYYLGPDKGGAKPYRLLSETLRAADRAALGIYMARGKKYVVLLRPFEQGLVMQQLRYAADVKAFTEIDIETADLKEGELDLAMRLVDQTATDHFKPEQYKDDVRNEVLELIERKVAGEEIVAAPEESPKAQIIDLMEALKASLGEEEPAEKKPAKKKPAKKPAKAAKTKPAKKSASQ